MYRHELFLDSISLDTNIVGSVISDAPVPN
jgi:hypothetical protein